MKNNATANHPPPMTRQQLRAALRRATFEEVTAKFPKEPRRARRLMARKLALRHYREEMKGKENK